MRPGAPAEALRPDLAPNQTTQPTTRRQDATLLGFAAILLIGLFADGWAHANIVDELEGFVTPWHTIVFVGYALTAGHVLLMVHRRRTDGRRLRAAIPPGHELAVVGVVAFAIGFNGDAIWHTIFGLESDTAALLSPTHLLMAASLLATVSTPWRTRPTTHPATWRTDGLRVASLLATALVVAFFLLYLWIPAFAIGSAGYSDWLASFDAPPFMTEVSQIAVLAAGFVITGVVIVPIVLLVRSGRPPAGALLLVALVPALGVTAIREFSNPQTLAAFLLAGVTAELIAARTDDHHRRTLLLGTAVPAVLWTTHWLLFAAVHGTGWDIELYPGQITSAVLAGIGIATLMRGPSEA